MKDDHELLRQYEKEFNLDYWAVEDQRDQSNEELRFSMVPGGHWESYLVDDYEDRAKLEIDETSDYLYRTYGQWVDNRMMPHFSPDDGEGTEDTAETIAGLLRRDMRRNNGQYAIDVAVFESMACGVGAYKVATCYEDEEDEDNPDQVAKVEPIHNAYSMVAWDASATRADKSDANRCNVLMAYSEDEFKAEWPDAVPTSAQTPDDRKYFNWRSAVADEIYVSCRYHVEYEKKKVYTYYNPLTGEKVKQYNQDEEAELTGSGFELLSERRVKVRTVYKTMFSGSQILEGPRRISGKHIPVIPVYGYRAFIDGKEYYFGVIRKRMDGQRLLNMTVSLAAEAAAHGPEDKLIFNPEQMSNPNIKRSWEQNRHQAPYLLADPATDDEGQVVANGPVGVAPGANLSQATQTLIDFVGGHLARHTGGAPQDTIDPDASGKAINAVIKRIDMNTRPIFDNIRDSLVQFGRVYLDVAREIYTDRIGRSAKVVSQDGSSSMVSLMALSAKDGKFSYENDISSGKFESVVEIGPNYETQREETVESLKDLYTSIIGSNPNNPLADILLNKLIIELPMTGMGEVKDYVRRNLLLQGVISPETEEDAQVLQNAGIQAGEDPQKKLIDATAANQETEAAQNMKEIEKADADIIARQAKARRDHAEAEAQEIDNALARLGGLPAQRRVSI